MQALALASGSSGDSERALDSSLLLGHSGRAHGGSNSSSRFGKWMQVAFSRDRGRIEGCAIRSYLLEQSRVAAPPNGAPARPPARPPARRDRATAQPPPRASATSTSCTICSRRRRTPSATRGASASAPRRRLPVHQRRVSGAGIDDVKGWADAQRILEAIGVKDEQRNELFGMLSAVLLLGNLTFRGTSAENKTAEKIRHADDPAPLKNAARLLQIDEAGLAKNIASRTMLVPSGGGAEQ